MTTCAYASVTGLRMLDCFSQAMLKSCVMSHWGIPVNARRRRSAPMSRSESSTTQRVRTTRMTTTTSDASLVSFYSLEEDILAVKHTLHPKSPFDAGLGVSELAPIARNHTEGHPNTARCRWLGATCIEKPKQYS
jgi:hypothetical protein